MSSAHDDRSAGRNATIRRLAGRFGVALAVLLGATHAVFAQRVVADFNGDGIDDLAVGAPDANNLRGSVSIFFGLRGQFPAVPSITRSARQVSEDYGAALAAADFNRDGRFELVVGAPTAVGSSGRVEILQFLRTGSGGIAAVGLSFTQDTAGVKGVAQGGDTFGAALAVGDFDGDGYPDLAIGAPHDSEAAVQAGVVNVLYGSPHGINADRDQLWHQGVAGISGSPEPYDFFGHKLAAGDFNGDGRDDLAIGVPNEDIGYADQGAVNVIYGDVWGLSSHRQQLLLPADTASTAGAGYGGDLIAGDFNGDGMDDLVISVAGGEVASIRRAGYVLVCHGTAGTLAPTSMHVQTIGGPQTDGRFGGVLIAADFNGDGFDDLAVGSPVQTVNGDFHAGAVSILYGMTGGSFGNEQYLHQDSSNVRDVSEVGDLFGLALAAGDFNGDGLSDLAVGVPMEDVAGNVDSGAVALFAGTTSGITTEGNQLLLAPGKEVIARFGLGLPR